MRGFVMTRLRGVYLDRPCWESGKKVSSAEKLAEEEWRWFVPRYVQRDTPPTLLLWSQDKNEWRKINYENVKDKEHRKQFLKKLEDKKIEQDLQHKNLTKKRPPSNKKDFINGIIGFSDDGIEDKTDEQLFECAKDYVAKLCDRLCGVKPIYLVMHKDETTRHFHFMLENTGGRLQPSRPGQKLKEGQKPSKTCTASTLFNNREYEKIQDLVAECFKPLGLRRGLSVSETHQHYKSVKEMHRNHIARLMDEQDKLKDQLESQKATIDAQRDTILRLETEVKGQQTALGELNINVAERERTIRDLDTKVADKKAEVKNQESAIASNSATIGFQTTTINIQESKIAKTRKKIEAEEERARNRRSQIDSAFDEYAKNRKAALDASLLEQTKNLKASLLEQTKNLKEKERLLKETEQKLAEYGDAANLAQTVGRFEAYIKDRNLEQDFEDWAAAYQIAQDKRDRYDANFEILTERFADAFEPEPER